MLIPRVFIPLHNDLNEIQTGPNYRPQITSLFYDSNGIIHDCNDTFVTCDLFFLTLDHLTHTTTPNSKKNVIGFSLFIWLSETTLCTWTSSNWLLGSELSTRLAL